MISLSNWDEKYLGLAKYISTWSKDPSTKVGAVIVSPENYIVSLGYNGFPKGFPDEDKYLNDRELKYKLTVHAEANAMASSRNAKGCTIYVFPFLPCTRCASEIVQYGISRVVSPKSENERWVEEWKLTRQIFSECKVLWDEVDFN